MDRLNTSMGKPRWSRLMGRLCRIAVLLVINFAGWRPVAWAGQPVVRAALFYTPTCTHCHKVIDEVLPPLAKKYGAQLQIGMVDTSTPQGAAVYKTAVQQFNIPTERQGVPTLIVGTEILVGEAEIPDKFPALIDAGLQAGGTDWPPLPGLVAALPSDLRVATLSTLSVADKLALDPVGNSLAILVLIGMVAVVGRATYHWAPRSAAGQRPVSRRTPKGWRKGRAESTWKIKAIPVLVVVGLVVSSYLAYVELNSAPAICGPVGDCNAVQQSSYARLYGVLPVGVLGVLGNLAIGGAWVVRQYASAQTAAWAKKGLLALTTVGVLFSIYLTFLEPFVIGAVCAWCLTSALVMTGMFELSVETL
jgi:uncharacterized membrane protein